jgi:hypothetical protein
VWPARENSKKIAYGERWPSNLPNADNKAVMPISPAAQKFDLFIVCSALDSSVTASTSSVLDLMLGKRQMADLNQNIAEPHAAIIAPVSMNGLIIAPCGKGIYRDHAGAELSLVESVLRCLLGRGRVLLGGI